MVRQKSIQSQKTSLIVPLCRVMLLRTIDTVNYVISVFLLKLFSALKTLRPKRNRTFFLMMVRPNITTQILNIIDVFILQKCETENVQCVLQNCFPEACLQCTRHLWAPCRYHRGRGSLWLNCP